ncbi:hypothetical protein GCM10020000_50050 [Streptomyces olivoverticillatus]
MVGVRDLVVDGADLALVMDLVRGTDLRTRLDRERRLAPEAAVAIVADVADALAAAHAAGIIHRDVKPENVLLDMQGPLGPGGAHPALLTDFGIARLVDSPRPTARERQGTGESGRVSGQRSVIGTPDYLAPEIIEGLPPRASVDVYALATVLYELLARLHAVRRRAPRRGAQAACHGDRGAAARHPRRAVAARRPVPGQGPPPPGCAPRSWPRGCASCCPAWPSIPPLDIDEPEEETAPSAAEPDGAYEHGAARPAAAPEPRRRGVVPLVPRGVSDSSRDTHTSMRVPGPEELAGGAHGTARAPGRRGSPVRAPRATGPRRRCASGASSSGPWPWRSPRRPGSAAGSRRAAATRETRSRAGPTRRGSTAPTRSRRTRARDRWHPPP